MLKKQGGEGPVLVQELCWRFGEKKAHFFVLFAFSLELAGNLLGFAVEKKKVERLL